MRKPRKGPCAWGVHGFLCIFGSVWFFDISKRVVLIREVLPLDLVKAALLAPWQNYQSCILSAELQHHHLTALGLGLELQAIMFRADKNS